MFQSMRRLILEFSSEEFDKFGEIPLYQKIKSFEILCFLRFDLKEFAVICRVEFEDASMRIEDLFPGEKINSQVLEQENEGTCTYFIKGNMHAHALSVRERLQFDLQWVLNFMGTGGYFTLYELKDGKVKIGFMGSAKQVKVFLKLIGREKIRYKVVSLTDAKFSLRSPLSQLTEKQRVVLVSAYELGYYDMPRRINSQGLAKKLSLRSSTLVEHRRKAERRVLAELLRE